MVSAKGKKGGKKCRKCVCKGSVDVLDGMVRKGLTEKVTPEQRPERGEVSHAHIWGGVGGCSRQREQQMQRSEAGSVARPALPRR